jgi:acetate kinase
VKTTLRKCIQLAPLHNPHNLKGIEACESLLPGTPQVAVFDTAFHQTIPPKAFLYGLPYVLYKKHRIRRYGFHGTSHRYVAQRAADILKRPIESLKLITCHLGNGASIAAVDGGRSVDTTMGFTPLEGLIMGTRCGSIDPALVPYLMEREKLGPKEIDSIMNKNSGMLGLTETSNDMREIEQEAARGSERHQLAIEMYCYRIRGYIGSFMAVLGRADAVVFTGGIGENSRVVRRLVTEGLDALGLAVDPAKNEKNETDISAGSVKVLVVPTNEELAIARDTRRMLETAREAKPAASAEPEVKASVDFRPEETAALVLAWARNPGADFGILAGELSLCLKRTLDARAVERELRRLCLVSGEPSLKPLKKKSTKA